MSKENIQPGPASRGASRAGALGDGGAICKWCPQPSVMKQGRIWLCARHYRFQSMRARAKRDGKAVPSYSDLEGMPEAASLSCPTCGRKMNWLAREGNSTVVTLQHDRSGAMRLLCLGCNTRHAAHPGDTFYGLKSGTKRCAACDQVKANSEFYRDNNKPPFYLKAYCRKCSDERVNAYRNRIREAAHA